MEGGTEGGNALLHAFIADGFPYENRLECDSPSRHQMHFSVSHSSRFAAPVPDQIDSSARKMKLLIKKTDNDGRLALIPDFLTTSWTIDVADSSNREELARKEVAVRVAQ